MLEWYCRKCDCSFEYADYDERGSKCPRCGNRHIVRMALNYIDMIRTGMVKR